MQPRRARHGGQSGAALMLLFAEMARIGFDKIPPATLITILGQAAIFMQIIVLPNRFQVTDVCISALNVWYRKDWWRLIFGAVQHADDWHLYYNMVSMLWKGIKIERKIGSIQFALILLIFTPLVSVMLLFLIGISEYVTGDSSYLTQCHVGFSGVLFALKVVLNDQEPGQIHYVFNRIAVSAHWIYWVELVLIHFMVPNSSFLGHLAGILVGILYIRGPFLKQAIETVAGAISGTSQPWQNRTFRGEGYSGYSSSGYSSHDSQRPSFYQEDPETIRLRRLNRLNS